MDKLTYEPTSKSPNNNNLIRRTHRVCPLFVQLLFVREYNFEGLTFIKYFLIRNILSLISQGFKYPIECRFVVIVIWHLF